MKIAIVEIEARLKGGESLRSIAASAGVSHQSLAYHRKRCGCRPLRKATARGDKHHSWKGGSFIDPRYGYKMVRTRRRLPYVGEHVLVAERASGRRLKRSEVVHHINGDPKDNRPENLEVCATQKEHLQKHVKVRREVARLQKILKEHNIPF